MYSFLVAIFAKGYHYMFPQWAAGSHQLLCLLRDRTGWLCEEECGSVWQRKQWIMTKSSTKAVINQSFPATYNFYRIRVEGTNCNDCIHGAVTHILSDDFNINCIILGVKLRLRIWRKAWDQMTKYFGWQVILDRKFYIYRVHSSNKMLLA